MTRLPFVAVAALALTALPGCPEPDPEGPDPYRDPREVTSLDADMSAVVAGNNAFALDLYGAAAAGDGNLFLSPFSVSAALAMTYAGAAGVTADEMADVLDVRLDPAAFHEDFGTLMRDLGGDHEGRGYTLSVANRIWGQEGYGWAEDFVAVNADDYGAPLEGADFTADPDAVREEINAWVAEQTREKIPELLQPGDVTVDTRMVLANAIYFKATWITQFDPADTRDRPFHLAGGGSVDVPTMSVEGEFEVAFLDGLSVLRLPYTDDEVSMLVLLPDDVDGLADLEAALSPEAIEGWVAALDTSELPVTLPRWELRYRADLASLLADLGMVAAFDPIAADFSGMTGGDNDLYIGRVIHEAYVKVDEEGTEAAAATAVAMEAGSAGVSFDADHPFVFVIRDDLTGAILFMGRVADPS